MSRESPRARLRGRPRSARGRGPSGRSRSTGPTTPIAPTGCPRWSKTGAAISASPTIASWSSRATPSSTIAVERVRQPGGVGDRPAGQRRELGRRAGAPRGRVGSERDDRLAERARVPRDRRAHLEDLHGVVGTEDVVHDQHVRRRGARRRARPPRPGSRASRPTAATAPAARGCRGTRSRAGASPGPSRYLPVSGSCSTSSCASSVRSSPSTVAFAMPEPLGELGHAQARACRSRAPSGSARPDPPTGSCRGAPRSPVDDRRPSVLTRPDRRRASAPRQVAVEVAPGILVADAPRPQVRRPTLPRLHRDRGRARPRRAARRPCGPPRRVTPDAHAAFERARAPARTRRRSSCRPPAAAPSPWIPSSAGAERGQELLGVEGRRLAERPPISRNAVPYSGPAAPPTR